MAIILNNKKSTYSSPYAYYTVETTETSNRTANSVDITFKITSNLAYSSSSLGRGYTLNANLYLNGNWSENITLKASSDSWSGTTKHYKTQSITVSGLGSSDTELSNVQFRVVSSASDNAAGLNATACSNIEIPTGHTPPVISSYSIAEVNNNLSGVSNDLIVERLSIKRFTVNYTLYDNATISTVGIYNNIYPYSITNFTITTPGTLTFDLDCSQINFVKSDTDNTKIPIVVKIRDNQDTEGTYPSFYTPNEYNYVAYEEPYIIDTNTTVARDGQTSGKVKLNVNGTFFNNNIGTQTPLITIKYKFWEAGASEPSTYNYTASTVSTSGNTFSVSNYEIGSETETDPNWFDPEKAYRVKVQVLDRYNNSESTELSIPVGESIWDEYKDHVDFKKITIKGEEVAYGDTGWQEFSWTNIEYVGTSQSSYTLNKWRVKSGILYVMIGAGKTSTINTSNEDEIARIPITGNTSFAEDRIWIGAVGGGGATAGFALKQETDYISIRIKPHTSSNMYASSWYSTHFSIPLDSTASINIS